MSAVDPLAGTFEVVFSTTQHDRLLMALGDALPPGVTEPFWRSAVPTLAGNRRNPRDVSALETRVHCRMDRSEALGLVTGVQQWLIDNPEDPDAGRDRRRSRATVAASLLAAARRVEQAGRLPRLAAARAAAAVVEGAPPGWAAHIRRMSWTVGEVETSLAWVRRHRLLVAQAERNEGVDVLRSTMVNGLTPKGVVQVMIPQWWMLLAPTAPWAWLPAPGGDAGEGALRWFRAARTVPRLHLVAERRDGPARWARWWCCDFLATCVADGLTPASGDVDAVRDAWLVAAGEPDPFEGRAISGVALSPDDGPRRVPADKRVGGVDRTPPEIRRGSEV